ncbi:deoxynucleoside kinase [Granulosicoccaceae sp. 1_MG-2023]|nr:deoxynucleoside kinase [Granulosicoccaceae sp. 1_MG-2023]
MSEKFIAIEGPIGVGKTTLARRIAEATGASLVRDPEEQNPFLEDFYKQSGAFAFQTQLDFLVRRIDTLGELALQRETQPVICDFLIDKDPLFASLTLDDNEFWLYQRVHDKLTEGLPEGPDLVIYLQADTPTLLGRIHHRGLQFEQSMASGYLQRLADAYSTFFYNYTASPLLIVNADEINFAENNRDFENLLAQIGQITAGRHFLNPLPA